MTVTNTAAGSSTFGQRWRYGLMRLVSLAADDRAFPEIATPNWVNVAINVLSTLLLIAVLWAAFRSVRSTEALTADDEERLRALLARHGDRDSLGYFALRRDKSVLFSPSGKAAVTYRVVGGVSLASGDPLGDPEAWPGAIEVWLAEAREHGWAPAVMGASEEGGTIYARHGLDALELGDEAIVDTAEFTLGGRAMRTVRQAYHRIERAGLHRPYPAPRGHPGSGDGAAAAAGRRLARRGDGARILDGAGAARRPGGRALRDARMLEWRRRGGSG